MNKKIGALVLLCSIASTMTQGVGTVAFAADNNSKDITTSVIETKDGQTDQYKYSILNDEITITKYLGNEKDVEIPDEISGVKVVAIGKEAFKDNGKIESVTVQDGVRSILSSAFNNCSNLKKVVLPEEIDYIGDCAFMNCKNLEEATMPKQSKDMGNAVFYNCSKLTEINIPRGITTIGIDFANGCSNLSEVTIPDTVLSILCGSFQECTSLREVTVPSSVNRIEAPFQDLKHIIIKGEKGSEAENYAKRASFQFSDINKVENEDDALDKEKVSSEFKYIVNSKEAEILSYVGKNEDVVIPDTIEGVKVTSIGTNAFKDNSNIKSVKLSDSIEIINNSAFENCSSLEAINIPESITKIKDRAFKDCSALNEVSLKENLESIGYNAFDGCTSLVTIYIPASVIMIENNAFDNCSSLEEINVSEDSRSYSSRNGILYSAKQDKEDKEDAYINLLKCPGGYKSGNVEISFDVNYIRFGAFNDAKNVKTLEFHGEKINLISVTDLITEKVKEENLTGINLTLDTLEKVSKSSKSKEGFSIKIGDNNETIVVSNDILPNNSDLNKDNNLGNDIEDKNNNDKKTDSTDDTEIKDTTGRTADLSSPLSLAVIMSLMGASIIKVLKTKRN